jgi:hypothetical protein
MPRDPVSITLDFGDIPKAKRRARMRDISAILQCGNDLWTASDETTTLERLSPSGNNGFGDCESFRLSKYVTLPTSEDEEVDLEGLAYENHYLWLTGSHSLKRQQPANEGDMAEDIAALAKIVRETNRFLIARIPLVTDPQTGRTLLQKHCLHPEKPKKQLHAAQLFGTAKSNMLVDALRDDAHLGRFLAIPAKENGFDIEGMAVIGRRIFLGVRGPVLRGWAVILEIQVEDISDDRFELRPIGPKGSLYRKHFFDLCGLGVRELCQHGDDLLILAGPTMDLDGNVIVYRWKNATKHDKEIIKGRADLDVVLEFRFDAKRQQGSDHPEGLCLFRDSAGHATGLLVAYDSPSSNRAGKRKVRADLFPLKGK